VGLAPIQRQGLEYEFDLVGYMDDENTLITDKTRCPFYKKKAITEPREKDFQPFVDWLKGAKALEKPAAAPAPKAAPAPAPAAEIKSATGRVSAVTSAKSTNPKTPEKMIHQIVIVDGETGAFILRTDNDDHKATADAAAKTEADVTVTYKIIQQTAVLQTIALVETVPA
jgi:hypothetical protein